MGHRIGLLILGFASLLVAHGASALGLGEITLKSNLNQPLNAEIKLLEVRDLTQEEILVSLASSEDFERQGVERPFLLTGFRFKVNLDASGGPVVVLTSRNPIREPFLNFILEARWPSGKLLREYTVLLDLPLFSDEAAAPVNPVQTETVSQVASTTTRTTTATRGNPRSAFDGTGVRPSSGVGYTPSVAGTYSGSEYQVAANDTLWEIALTVRPDSAVSVHQTMMALHRANPEAFINGNINLLKSGQILRVPDVDQIRVLNQQQAVREVAQHNAEWTGGAAPLDASRSASYDDVATDSGEGRLSLASPDDAYDAVEGRISGGGADSSADATALRSELVATQETLDKTRGENQELRSKIDSLEEQITTLESMIEVSSDSLRALELAAAQNNQTDDTEETVSIEDALTDAEMAIEPELADADSSIDDLDATGIDAVDEVEDVVEPEAEPEVEQPKIAEPPKVVQQPVRAPEPSIVDLIMANLLYIVLGLVAVVVAIFVFLKKRGSDDDDEEFDDFLETEPQFEAPGYDAFTEETVEPEVDNAFESPADDVLGDEFDIPAESKQEEEVAEPQTEDVVAESDIYIAYGKYDQAEEMLQKALDADADHHEARIKLLEIYAAQGDLSRFDPCYATLRASSAADSLISRAAALRSGIHDAGDFNESLYSGGESAGTDAGSLDDDFNIGALDELDSPADEDEFSLDLGDIEQNSSIESAEADEFDLDLDLPVNSSIEAEDSNDFDLDGLDFGEADDSSSGLVLDEGIELDTDSAQVEEESLDFDLGELETLAPESEEIDIDLDMGDVAEASVEADLGADLDLSADLAADLDSDLDFDLGADLTSDLPSAADEDESFLDVLDDGLDVSADSSPEEPAAVTESFDLSSLDEELEALTSDLDGGDLSATAIGDALDLDDVAPSKSDDASNLMDLEDSLADLDQDLSNLSAGGESIEDELDLGDLEAGLSELSESTPAAEPDLDFADLDDELAAAPTAAPEVDSLDFDLPELDPSASDDDDLDFLSDSDETATKLDLAAAYIDMGDMSGAKEIIGEILKEGNAEQQASANELLARIGD